MTVFDVEIAAAFGTFVIILILENGYILIHIMVDLSAGLTGRTVPESHIRTVISGLGSSADLFQCIIIKNVF